MSSVSGLLKIGEASPTVQTILTRTRGARYTYLLIAFVMMAVGAAIGYFGWQRDPVLGLLVGYVCGAAVYLLLARRLTVARFRKRLTAKGSPLNLSLRMEITQDALVYEVGDILKAAKWPCVSELFDNHGYWIFLAQSSPYFAPKRFFADREAERAFIKEALAHMNEAARSRSRDAVAFAEAR